MTEKHKEGWAQFYPSRRDHYIVDGESLCGKWLYLGDVYDWANRMCKECKNKLVKRESNSPPAKSEK